MHVEKNEKNLNAMFDYGDAFLMVQINDVKAFVNVC